MSKSGESNTPERSRPGNIATPGTSKVTVDPGKSKDLLMGSGGFYVGSRTYQTPVSFSTTKKLTGHEAITSIAKAAVYKTNTGSKGAVDLPEEILGLAKKLFQDEEEAIKASDDEQKAAVDDIISPKNLSTIAKINPDIGVKLQKTLTHFINEKDIILGASKFADENMVLKEKDESNVLVIEAADGNPFGLLDNSFTKNDDSALNESLLQGVDENSSMEDIEESPRDESFQEDGSDVNDDVQNSDQDDSFTMNGQFATFDPDESFTINGQFHHYDQDDSFEIATRDDGPKRYLNVGEIPLNQVITNRVSKVCTDFIWDLDEILKDIKSFKVPKAAAENGGDVIATKTIKEELSDIQKSIGKNITDKTKKTTLTKAIKKQLPENLGLDVCLSPQQKEAHALYKNQLNQVPNDLQKVFILQFYDTHAIPRPQVATPAEDAKSDSASKGEDYQYVRSLVHNLNQASLNESEFVSNILGIGESFEEKKSGFDEETSSEKKKGSDKEYFAYRVVWNQYERDGVLIDVPEITFLQRSGGKRPDTELGDGHQGDHVTAYAACLHSFINTMLPLDKYDGLVAKVEPMLQSCFVKNISNDEDLATLHSMTISDDERRNFRETTLVQQEDQFIDRLIKHYQIDCACSYICTKLSECLERVNKEVGGSMKNKMNIDGLRIEASTGGHNEGDVLDKLGELSRFLSFTKLSKEFGELLEQDPDCEGMDSRRSANLRHRKEHCDSQIAQMDPELESNKYSIINECLEICFDFDINFALFLHGKGELTNEKIGLDEENQYVKDLLEGAVKRHFRIIGIALAPILANDETIDIGQVCSNFLSSLSDQYSQEYDRILKKDSDKKYILTESEQEQLENLNQELASYSGEAQEVAKVLWAVGMSAEDTLLNSLKEILKKTVALVSMKTSDTPNVENTGSRRMEDFSDIVVEEEETPSSSTFNRERENLGAILDHDNGKPRS